MKTAVEHFVFPLLRVKNLEDEMTHLKTQFNLTMFLGVLSILAGLFAHLALTDIYHVEGDLSLEWNVLRLCAVIIAAFIVSAMMLMRKMYKAI